MDSIHFRWRLLWLLSLAVGLRLDRTWHRSRHCFGRAVEGIARSARSRRKESPAPCCLSLAFFSLNHSPSMGLVVCLGCFSSPNPFRRLIRASCTPDSPFTAFAEGIFPRSSIFDSPSAFPNDQLGFCSAASGTPRRGSYSTSTPPCLSWRFRWWCSPFVLNALFFFFLFFSARGRTVEEREWESFTSATSRLRRAKQKLPRLNGWKNLILKPSSRRAPPEVSSRLILDAEAGVGDRLYRKALASAKPRPNARQGKLPEVKKFDSASASFAACGESLKSQRADFSSGDQGSSKLLLGRLNMILAHSTRSAFIGC